MRHFAIAEGRFEVTRQEIESLRYLKKARVVADYLGIPQAQVEDVWAEMPDRREYHNHYLYNKPERESSGLNQLAEARESARIGSDKLKRALGTYFRNWEVQNGFREGAGVILVPAGFQP